MGLGHKLLSRSLSIRKKKRRDKLYSRSCTLSEGAILEEDEEEGSLSSGSTLLEGPGNSVELEVDYMG